MQLTGVTGWPVAHSRSPALHQAAFDSLGLHDWASQLLPIPPDLFDETVKALPENGFVGINVTIPHKEAALHLATSASESAVAIGAANTLSFGPSGQIAADNTDAPAIASAVAEFGPTCRDSRRALVLGAGGSARAAIFALLGLGFAEVAVWNRNAERAEALLPIFEGLKISGGLEGYSVIVNATPVGLQAGTVPGDLGFGDEVPADCELIVDLVYAAGGTDLRRLAEARQIGFVDGLEILARQGALSIEIWTGSAPDLAPLRAAVSDA